MFAFARAAAAGRAAAGRAAAGRAAAGRAAGGRAAGGGRAAADRAAAGVLLLVVLLLVVRALCRAVAVRRSPGLYQSPRWMLGDRPVTATFYQSTAAPANTKRCVWS